MTTDIETSIKSLIRRRRAQMLVNSCIYYHLNDSLVSDHTWQEWADELRDLQAKFPAPIGYYDSAFKDWTGDTGCHLPFLDQKVLGMAEWLLAYNNGGREKEVLI